MFVTLTRQQILVYSGSIPLFYGTTQISKIKHRPISGANNQ